MSIKDKKIVFYGAGEMAEAIARGILSQKLVSNKNLAMLNRNNEARLHELNDLYGVQTEMQGLSKLEYIKQADIIFLAMKPKDAVEALDAIEPYVKSHQLIISVIAGLSIDSMEQLLGDDLPLVRSMPNTSSRIGYGVTGISYSPLVSEEQRAIVEKIYQSIGISLVIDEDQQDAITSISGSGPAYVYFIMEQMMNRAIETGFSVDDAKKLVSQTVLGAAEMVIQSGENPGELRRKVTSPNGTTQAAIEKMTEMGLPKAIFSGMESCQNRAKEIRSTVEEDLQIKV